MMYCYSTNEEIFQGTCEAETYEQAAEEAIAVLGVEDGERFWVGVREDVIAENYVDADRLLDDLSVQVYENVGEVSDGWPDASRADVVKLESRLRDTVRAWLEETGHKPTFYRVVDAHEFRSRDGRPVRSGRVIGQREEPTT